MLVLIPRWPQASTFLGCQALGFATSLLVALALVAPRLSANGWRVRRFIAVRSVISSIWAAWQLAAQGGGLIAGQADRYLLGALLQPQFVGFYTIAQRLEEAMYIGVLKVGEILFPFFSALQKESRRSQGRSAVPLFLDPQRARRERAWRPDSRRRPAASSVDRRGSGRRGPAGAGGAVDRRHTRMRARTSLHSIFWRNGRSRSNALISLLTARVHAGDQRDRVALFRMAGGGMERLRRHDRPDRHRP